MHLLNALPQRLDPGATPTFAGLISATLTSPAATNLTLGTGTYGTALTFASSTGAATFAGAVTAGGNVTVNGSAGVTASDLTLGTSGPSVKSSLAARAARQGLVFDGTAQASVTLPTIGTADWTFSAWINPTSFAAERAIIGANANTGTDRLGFIVTTGGAINFNSGSTTNLTSTGTIAAGKFSIVTAYRSGNSIFVSINGATPENIGSCASLNITNTSAVIGKWSNNFPLLFLGAISGALIFNRALSATEVVSLYESGVPSGADYSVAVNGVAAGGNLLTSGVWSSGGTGITVSSTSNTGFTASGTGNNAFAGGVFGQLGSSIVARVGMKYRATWTYTAVSGETPTVGLAWDGNGVWSNTVSATAGSAIFTVTANQNAAKLAFLTSNGAATSYSVSGITMTPLGLLLAPDAAQAGGGLAWYDTSGNAANITLPASGVTWNVPTSGYVTSGSLLNLAAGGTNQNITLTPSGTGELISAGTNSRLLFVNSGGPSIGYSSTFDGLQLRTASTVRYSITNGGRHLFGTGVDSGALLQVGTNTTTSAGGMVFGTDSFLYRLQAATLAFDATNPAFYIRDAGQTVGRFSSAAGITYIDALNASNTGSLVFRTGNGGNTALTLSSTQTATFASTLTVGAGTSAFNVGNSGQLTVASNGAATDTPLQISNTAQNWQVRLNGSNSALWFYNVTGGSVPLILASTGAATFAGAVAINNTVATAVAVASTHKVTMVIGGVTYYLLASNV